MSADGVDMLTELEGLRTEMYLDVAGLPTIGVGHLLTKDELSSGKINIESESVKYRDGITGEQAMMLLAKDVRRFEDGIARVITSMLAGHQFDALVSFAFNVGVEAFRSSTLLKRINAGRFEDVPAQMRRWIYSGGATWDGLVTRREVEIERWERRDA